GRRAEAAVAVRRDLFLAEGDDLAERLRGCRPRADPDLRYGPWPAPRQPELVRLQAGQSAGSERPVRDDAGRVQQPSARRIWLPGHAAPRATEAEQRSR